MRRLLPLRVLHYDVQQAVISLLCRSFVTTEWKERFTAVKNTHTRRHPTHPVSCVCGDCCIVVADIYQVR